MNNKSPTTLHLPGHLPFPVTITSLLIKSGSTIKKHEGLLVYKFVVSENGEDDGESSSSGKERSSIMRKEMFEQFDSSWEGTIKEWYVKEGATISSSRSVLFILFFYALRLMCVYLVNRFSHY
jgi:RNA polymerase II subunit A C-terminal domain phosphatase